MFAFLTRKLSQVTATVNDTRTDIPSKDEGDSHKANDVETVSTTETTVIAQAQVTNGQVQPAENVVVGAATTAIDHESSHAQESATKDGAAQAPQDVLQPLRPTPHSISARIKKVPAKTFHEFALSQLANADESTLKALATFFENLKPPPKLHCVRCHKDFTEVENDDRSCLVPHDDESAEVERVGRGADLRTTADTPASSYQTLWGCCGKVTDGDGSHGPPDGWCYEGKHTIDIRRARFRADSTPQDDKLVSCLRLNCHNVRDALPHRRTRQRVRASLKEASDEESDGASDSGVDEITGQTSSKKARSKASSKTSKSKGKEKEVDGDAMDVDGKLDVAPDASEAALASAAKRKPGRPRKSAAASTTDSVAGDEQETPAPKRRGRPPKRGRGRPRKILPAGGITFPVDPVVGVTQPTNSLTPAPAPAINPGHAHSAPVFGQTPGATYGQVSAPASGPTGTQPYYQAYPTQPYVPSPTPATSAVPYYPPPTSASVTAPSTAPPAPHNAYPTAISPYTAQSSYMMIKQTPNSTPVLMLAPGIPQGARITSMLTASPSPTADATPAASSSTTAVSATSRKRRQSKLNPDATEGAGTSTGTESGVVAGSTAPPDAQSELSSKKRKT